MPVFLISLLALTAQFLRDAADIIEAAEDPADEEPDAPMPEPPSVPSSPPPSAVEGETYAEFFARTGYLLKGPDDHEISGFHVFDGHAWVPATA